MNIRMQVFDSLNQLCKVVRESSWVEFCMKGPADELLCWSCLSQLGLKFFMAGFIPSSN